VFAQSVVEYGGLAAATATLQSLAYGFRDWVAQLGVETWIVLGGLVVLVVWLKRR
jgi:hypothetical protein